MYGGIHGWGFAAREHFRAELARFGYKYTSAKEVRGQKKNGRFYDFLVASRHYLARDLFEKVTKENRFGQRSLF